MIANNPNSIVRLGSLRTACVLAVCLIAACRAKTPSDRLTRLAVDAASGDSLARYNLAVELYRGDSLSRNYQKAAALWRQAMTQGDVDAMSNYAFLLYEGLGIRANPDSAVKLWRQAASRGQLESQKFLGYAALVGKGEPRDTIEAIARYQASIIMGEQSRDSVDSVIVADSRHAIALLPARSEAETHVSDSLTHEYTRVPIWRRP